MYRPMHVIGACLICAWTAMHARQDFFDRMHVVCDRYIHFEYLDFFCARTDIV